MAEKVYYANNLDESLPPEPFKSRMDPGRTSALYKTLREILPPPVLVSTGPDGETSFVPRAERYHELGNQYGWELFKVEGSVVMLEYHAWWGNGFRVGQQPPAPQEAQLSSLRVTLHDPTPELEQRIEKLFPTAVQKSA